MGTFEIEFKIDTTVRSLVYISEAYRLDLLTLLLLYDRFGEDLFYFFYLFAGRKISIPKFAKLTKIQMFSHNFANINPDTLKSKQEKSAYSKIRAITTKKNTVVISHNCTEKHGYTEENSITIRN